MRELFDAELNLTDAAMDRAALEAAVQRAGVLVPTITDIIDSPLLARAGDQLKMIANFGAGVDHIDLEAAVGRGLIVTNTPGVLTEDTADLAMGLILAVSRRIVEGAQVVAEGRFEGWTPTWMTGRKLWASGWASSAWAGSARPWRGGRRPSACRSTITTASRFRTWSRRNWGRRTGTIWTRCWPGWTSSR